MPVPQILVIDPAMKTAETAAYNTIALASPVKTTYHLPALFGLQSLQAMEADMDLADLRGIIIFGSASSVHDRLEWQIALEAWLRPHLARGVPTLGICYGHQMLAHMFGGEVGYVFPDQKKHSGMRMIEVAALPWFEPGQGLVAVSHNEMVQQAPERFQTIATSADCRTDGLAHRDLPIWTFQSHPEATRDFLINHEIDATDVKKQLEFGHKIIFSFLAYAAAKH